MNYKSSLYSKIIADCEKLSGMPVSELIGDEITNIDCLRKWLVKKKYQQEQAKNERSLTDIKNELSEKYEISVSSIEKLVYGRRW